MNRWFAGELLVMVPGLVAAATPGTVVAAVAASQVAVAAVAAMAASPMAVVVVRCEGTRASASSSDIDAITTDRRLLDRSVWHPQNNARMHPRLGEHNPD